MILLSSFVFADLTTDNEVYFSFDDSDLSGNDILDVGSGNSNTGTNEGATTGTSGVLNQDFSFTTNDYIINDNLINDISTNTVGTFCSIVTFDNLNTATIWSVSDTNADSKIEIYLDGTNNYITAVQRIGGVWKWGVEVQTALSIDTDYFICLEQDGTQPSFYIDNVDQSANENFFITSDKTTWINSDSGLDNVRIGALYYNSNAHTKFIDADIDELGYWSKVLIQTDRDTYYNSGNGHNPFSAVEYYFELTLSNSFNSSNISSFTAQITNSTVAFNVSTTNGSIFYANINDEIDIFIFGATNYFNQSYNNINTSSDFQAETYQAILTLDAKEKITGNEIGSFNATVGNQYNTSNSLNKTIFYLNAGSYNISGRADKYTYNSTGTFTLFALENASKELYFAPNLLNIIAREYFFNSTINSFTIQINYNDTYFENITTTNGYIEYYGHPGNHNITIKINDYADQNEIINISHILQNKTFYLYTTNSIYMRFFDEVTKELLDSTTINVELISSIMSDNDSTTNGILYVDILSPAIYTIRTSTSGYDTRFYQYTLLNNTNTYIPIYLVNSTATNYKQIEITVIDEAKKDVGDATIKLLRFDIETNSYVIREIVITNFEGLGYLDVIQFEEFYKIIIEYDGEVKYSTEKFQINKDTYTFQIVKGTSVGDDFFRAYQVATAVIFNYATNTFRFEFIDPANQVTAGCLEIYKTNVLNASTFIDYNCANGTTGIVYVPITPINGSSYSGLGFVYFGDTEQHMDSEVVHFSSVPDLTDTNEGIFIVFLFTALFFGAFIKTQEPLFVTLIPLPLLLGSLIKIINIEFGYAFGFQIIGIIVALFLTRKNNV